MKKNIVSKFWILIVMSGCSPYMQDLSLTPCSTQEKINTNYSKANAIQLSVKQLVNDGVPGCAIAIYSDEGWWTTSDGYAKIENKARMETCHLHYLQSIAKTYMSIAILKLYEQGKIDLDTAMTKYLPERYSRYITGAGKITVRMLLNHTSGIPEYNSAPAYITTLLQHPNNSFSPEDYLRYINEKPLDFAPGSKYSYRNTNYVILALLCDAITGDHAKFLSESIFKPLGLSNTFYRGEPGYLNYPNLVNSYWDRYSDGIVENVSQLQRNNIAALIGDDGIVATPIDAVKFLKGLMEGKLLSAATLEIMKSWAKDSKGNFTYGLGLDYSLFQDQIAYGHSGGGIGAGCQLYYFPAQGTYIFIGINLGTVTESPIHEGVEKTLDTIYKVLLEQ
jgi:D-alanyl-D-alanine carboxypeptidase